MEASIVSHFVSSVTSDGSIKISFTSHAASDDAVLGGVGGECANSAADAAAAAAAAACDDGGQASTTALAL